MQNRISKIAILFILILVGCAATISNTGKITRYDLTKPESIILLPDTLREISGLTAIDSVTFACIQDENGILFLYDISKNEIKKQYSFHIDGDYEGIARVGSSMYVLRSDGTLFQISNYESANFELTTFVTNIPATNNEGLCYDASNNRLLIASKGKIAKGPENKDKRAIYAFDLKTKKMIQHPIYEFDLKAIKQFAIKNKIIIPEKFNKKEQLTEPFIKFMASAIAIHPLTKKLYLLSAADHLFFIINRNGDIEHLEPLNSDIFNKAEGITFLDNGDMLITNEGQNKKPTLLRFNYKQIK